MGFKDEKKPAQEADGVGTDTGEAPSQRQARGANGS